MKSKLLIRSLSGAVFVVVLLNCIWPGFGANVTALPAFFLFGVVSLVGLSEFYRMAEKTGAAPRKLKGMFIGLALFLIFFHRNFFSHEYLALNLLFALLFFSIFLLFISELFKSSSNPFQNISSTLLGVIYTVLPFALLMETAFYRNYYEPRILLGVFFLIWANDTFAYLVGSLIGKNKLLERISPGKTWEGFLGGGFFTLLLAWFLFDVFEFEKSNIWHFERLDWLVIGLLVFVFGTLGDLTESMFKRSAGVKDSGNVMAGHGGILDRFDSLIFVAPLVYAYLYFIKSNLENLKILLREF